MGININGVDRNPTDILMKTAIENQEKDLRSEFSDAVREIYDKVKNGDTEESIPIGGQSFTVKEWDRMMKRFDRVQEGIRQSIEEEIERRKAKEENREERQKVVIASKEDDPEETEDILLRLL